MEYTYKPSRVETYSDYPEDEIDWIKVPTSELLVNNRWRTSRQLKHIANPATGDIRDRTYTLECTDFNITDLPDVISGLSLRVVGQRNGRVSDDIIQLTHQGQLIGENNVSYLVDIEGHFLLLNDTTYGGPTDLWGADLTPEILRDPTFGVVLKFQSHPFYPHSSGMTLDSVSITVY